MENWSCVKPPEQYPHPDMPSEKHSGASDGSVSDLDKEIKALQERKRQQIAERAQRKAEEEARRKAEEEERKAEEEARKRKAQRKKTEEGSMARAKQVEDDQRRSVVCNRCAHLKKVSHWFITPWSLLIPSQECIWPQEGKNGKKTKAKSCEECRKARAACHVGDEGETRRKRKRRESDAGGAEGDEEDKEDKEEDYGEPTELEGSAAALVLAIEGVGEQMVKGLEGIAKELAGLAEELRAARGAEVVKEKMVTEEAEQAAVEAEITGAT